MLFLRPEAGDFGGERNEAEAMNLQQLVSQQRKDRDDVFGPPGAPTMADDAFRSNSKGRPARPPESNGKRRKTINPAPQDDFQRRLQKTSSISSQASRNKVVPAPA